MFRQLTNTVRAMGWIIHDRPLELNIVGVRASNNRPGLFDDHIHVFYRDRQGRWKHEAFPATTDPGTHWLRNPLMPQGTALLGQGQYQGAYGIARHRGKYRALCQIHKPVTVIRDFDRDNELDFDSGRKQTGFFGINIHRASAIGTSLKVDRWSAGCQVLARAGDFERLMTLADRHVQATGANKFTYSLIDFRAMHRTRLRTWANRFAMGAIGLGTGYMFYKAFTN